MVGKPDAAVWGGHPADWAMALLLHEHQDEGVSSNSKHDFYFDRKNFSSYEQQVPFQPLAGALRGKFNAELIRKTLVMLSSFPL